MLRFLIVLAVLATVSACSQPVAVGQAWRASEMNGDKPALGYELRRVNGAVAGDAYILSPDFPHDFSHGRRAAMTVVEQSPKEIVFRVRWSDDLKGTLRFRFKDADWPDAFQATVTEINGAEEYDSDTFNFTRIR